MEYRTWTCINGYRDCSQHAACDAQCAKKNLGMKIKVMTFKASGKYYTEESSVRVPDEFATPWDMCDWMKREIKEGRIPGLVDGAKNFHVLVTDLDTGLPYLFPLNQKEVL